MVTVTRPADPSHPNPCVVLGGGCKLWSWEDDNPENVLAVEPVDFDEAVYLEKFHMYLIVVLQYSIHILSLPQ